VFDKITNYLSQFCKCIILCTIWYAQIRFWWLYTHHW